MPRRVVLDGTDEGLSAVSLWKRGAFQGNRGS